MAMQSPGKPDLNGSSQRRRWGGPPTPSYSHCCETAKLQTAPHWPQGARRTRPAEPLWRPPAAWEPLREAEHTQYCCLLHRRSGNEVAAEGGCGEPQCCSGLKGGCPSQSVALKQGLRNVAPAGWIKRRPGYLLLSICIAYLKHISPIPDLNRFNNIWTFSLQLSEQKRKWILVGYLCPYGNGLERKVGLWNVRLCESVTGDGENDKFAEKEGGG